MPLEWVAVNFGTEYTAAIGGQCDRGDGEILLLEAIDISIYKQQIY